MMDVKLKDIETDIIFLQLAADYFLRRDTHGEDRAHWANVYNSQHCLDIVKHLKQWIKERNAPDYQTNLQIQAVWFNEISKISEELSKANLKLKQIGELVNGQ